MTTSSTRPRKTAASRPAQPRNDSPRVHLSSGELSRLDAEAAAEPYVYITATNHRITFPDPFAMEWEEAEAFLGSLDRVTNSATALQEWLSAEDYAALRADKLTLRQGLILVQKIQAHYSAFMGSPGEGKSSPS